VSSHVGRNPRRARCLLASRKCRLSHEGIMPAGAWSRDPRSLGTTTRPVLATHRGEAWRGEDLARPQSMYRAENAQVHVLVSNPEGKDLEMIESEPEG
jgi:hypothetical protein